MGEDECLLSPEEDMPVAVVIFNSSSQPGPCGTLVVLVGRQN